MLRTWPIPVVIGLAIFCTILNVVWVVIAYLDRRRDRK